MKKAALLDESIPRKRSRSQYDSVVDMLRENGSLPNGIALQITLKWKWRGGSICRAHGPGSQGGGKSTVSGLVVHCSAEVGSQRQKPPLEL